ncbi:DMT family transporter [Rhizobium sp. XQZ8]|uniref:DMT family transporter n=1 Tax=Rhizobium populisoli TaxID=2859785 RepID=UPI001C685EAC|nr:DMT family transporter [Rhizobium populisoli]MBW6422752.1 DMT family transporter [Rhizobium populisoli]
MSAPSASLSKPQAESRVVHGLGLMIIAMLIAPLIDIFSKLSTDVASPTFITAARFVFQALFMLPIVLWNGSWRQFSWKLSFYHAIRAAIITLSMICFVAALAVMEVADTVAIFFVEPIMLTVLSSIFLKEVIGWRRYTACAVGFLGAMIVIRPSFQEIGLIALLPIVSALCVAIFALMTRALAHREDPWAMQFQMALWGMPICALLLVVGDVTDIAFMAPVIPGWLTFTFLIGVGVAASVSGILGVYAYRAAPASVIAPLQYFEIISATLFGWLVFGDFPDPIKWLGISIIIGSGLYIIWRERRAASQKPVTNTSETSVTP